MGFRGPQVQILSPRPSAYSNWRNREAAYSKLVIDLEKIKREDPERQLEVIRRWWAEHTELANHPRLTLSDWLARSQSERSAVWQVAIDAVRSVENLNEVRLRISALGQQKYAPAVPILIDIWRRCAVEPIRAATGHALVTIDSPASRAALREGVDDRENLDRILALQTLLTDEGAPWDKLGPLFAPERLATDAGVRVAADALGFLAPSSYSREGPEWRLESARRLIEKDPRWLDLCVTLRHHPTYLGHVARDALRYSDPKVTTPALDTAARVAAARKRPQEPAPVPGSLLARYEAGEHRQVWRELAAADPRDLAWREEADLVAVTTMAHVRRNAERLVAALIANGWPVRSEVALPGVPGDTELRLRQLEEMSGSPVPSALKAFWRTVGSINLVPANAELPHGLPSRLIMLDPLEVESLSEVWSAVEEWRDEANEVHPEIAGPIEVPISADHLHKANISGGAPYSIWLPSESVDPIVRYEPHKVNFTDYLRLAFDRKGFLFNGEQPEQPEDREALVWIRNLDFEPEPF